MTVFKPAGIPVFPPHDDEHGDCVLRRLLRDAPEVSDVHWPDGFAGGIAHRLDVSTSGALWVAESTEELERMRERFSQGQLRKTYYLRVARRPSWTHNQVDRPVAHDRRKRRRMTVQRGPNTPHRGRWYPASTTFTHRHGDVFQAVITTGVMHQIRVHAAFVGIPLLGDGLYGGGETPPDAPDGLRFFLHHEGLVDPDGWGTDPVRTPEWASPQRA